MTSITFVGGPLGGTTVEVELPEPYRGVFLPQPKFSHEKVHPAVAWPGNLSLADALAFNLVVCLEEAPAQVTQRQEMKPDTHTLELCFGMTLAEAIKARQVRLIREPRARVLASVYLKVVRYRNADGDKWEFVDYAK